MASSGKTRYVYGKIEDLITSKYPIGSMLPTELQLVELYKSTRGTVRNALDDLVQEGIISRRSGIGTVVVRKPKKGTIISFSEQVRRKGQTPSTRVLETAKISAQEAGGRFCEAFPVACEMNDQALRISRLRCADDHPVALQTIFLLASHFRPGILEDENLQSSLFDFYAEHGRRPATADEIIHARKPTKKELDLLYLQDLPDCDQLVYERNRITYDHENLPLEVLCSIERADFFGKYQYRLLADSY